MSLIETKPTSSSGSQDIQSGSLKQPTNLSVLSENPADYFPTVEPSTTRYRMLKILLNSRTKREWRSLKSITDYLYPMSASAEDLRRKARGDTNNHLNDIRTFLVGHGWALDKISQDKDQWVSARKADEDPLDLPENSKTKKPIIAHLPEGISFVSSSKKNAFFLTMLTDAYKHTPLDLEEITKRLQEEYPNTTAREIDSIITSCRQVLARKSLGWTTVYAKQKGSNGENRVFVSLKKIISPTPTRRNHLVSGNPDQAEDGDDHNGEIQSRDNGYRFPLPDPESLAVIAGLRSMKNQSPEEEKERKKLEVLKAKHYLQITMSITAIRSLQDSRVVFGQNIAEVIKTASSYDNFKSIVEDDSPQGIRRFAIDALIKTLQKWWSTKDINDLEPIERKPAGEILKLKEQGLDIQEVLSQISNKL